MKKDFVTVFIRVSVVLSWLFLALVILCPSIFAQTRVYLPSSGAAAVSPAFSAGWDDIPSADRIALATASGGSTAQTLLTSTDANTTTDTDQLLRQYVSPPLNGNQTISGTVRGVIKASESANTQNARAQMTIYVVSNDGSLVRGTALPLDTSALSSEFSTSNVTRKFPLAAINPATLSSVSALDCDRIVIELGSRNHSTGVGALVRLTFGDDSASDLTDGEGASNVLDPWIEFSGAISFRAEGACAAAARRVIVVN